MSKLPVRETRRPQAQTEAWLEILRTAGPFLISAITACWIAFQYFESSQKDREQRAAAQIKESKQAERDISARISEARKPFNELQLKTYQEIASVTALLATTTQGGDAYSSTKADFYRFYWSRLSMVEDGEVETAMVNLERAIRNYATDWTLHQRVRVRVYCLARALKSSTERSWTIHLPDAANLPKLDGQSRKDCEELEDLSSSASKLERN